MSLRWYRMPRMVVLAPENTVMEAARALENNNIGAVIIQKNGQVVGIVTDRDLAVRAMGQAMDARKAQLSEVMSSPVVTLEPRDDQQQALRLMQQHNIRRIPLVEAGKIVGIVTLDDLILDEAVSPEDLAAVIQQQIGGGGPATSRTAPSQRRRAARAASTYGRMLNLLAGQAGLQSSEEADIALEIVLSNIVRRLTPDEADDLIAQLPSLSHPVLRGMRHGPDPSITRRSIEIELSEALKANQPSAADILDAVGAIVAQTVTPGEIEDVRGQLPAEMRSIFPQPAPANF